MATSATTLCQMALGYLGVGDVTLSNVDTDQTAVARAFRTFYVPTRDWLLQQTPWNFATRYFSLIGQTGTGTVTVSGTNLATFSVDQDLSIDPGDTITIGTTDYLIGARTSGLVFATSGANVTSQPFTIVKNVVADPTDDWAYGYRLPEVAWQVRRLVDGNRMPIAANRPVFRVGNDGTYNVLYTDYSDPVTIEYTARVTDTTLFSPVFDNALAAFLAFYAAPLITKGDPSNLGMRAAQMGQAFLADAVAFDANQRVMDDDPLPDSLQFRNGGSDWTYSQRTGSGL
jgi:hypothetical protein